MSIVALVFLSVAAAWTFVMGGMQGPGETGPSIPVRTYWLEVGRAMTRLRTHQPPDRKSIIVDTTGAAHSTADLTRSTKRDRSRPYLKLDIQQTPPEASAALPAPIVRTQVGAPLFQMQTEEIPRIAPTPPNPLFAVERGPSLGRRVQTALMADKSLSRSAQLTVRATSTKDKVTLRGIVLDEEERAYIEKKVSELVGPGNVDDRLTVL